MKVVYFLNRQILSRPMLCWGVVVTLFVTALLIVASASIPKSLLESFISDPAKLKEYRKLLNELTGSTDSLIYFALDDGKDLFTVKKFNAIRKCANQLKGRDDVVNVLCLTDAPRTNAKSRLTNQDFIRQSVLLAKLTNGNLPEKIPPQKKYWPSRAPTNENLDLSRLKKAMLEDPAVANRLVSGDGQAHLMVIELRNSEDKNGYQLYQTYLQLQKEIDFAGLGTNGIYAGGVIVGEGLLFKEMLNCFLILLPVGAVLISFLIFAVFRRLSLVVLTIAIGSIASILGVAATILIFGQVSVLIGAVPLLVMIISSSDVIHLISAYFGAIETGSSHEESVQKMLRDVSGACLVTSVTTFAGLLSLVFVPVATMQHFAVASAVGVASALILAVIFVPLVLNSSKPVDVTRASSYWINQWISSTLAGCHFLSRKFSLVVAVVGVAMVIGGLWLTQQKSWRADLVARFPDSHPIKAGEDFIRQKFGGVHSIEIFLRSPSSSMFDDNSIKPIHQFVHGLNDIQGVTKTQSVFDAFAAGDRLIDFQTENGLPESRIACETFLTMIRESDNSAIDGMIRQDNSMMRLVVTIDSSSFLEAERIVNEIESKARETIPDSIEIQIGGTYAILGRATKEVMKQQVFSFGICFLSVSLILVFSIGSLSTGFLAILPNLLPLAMLFGCLSIFTEQLDSDLILIAIAGFGLAVDDTIHFLHRYNLEVKRNNNVAESVRLTFQHTGAAMTRTTLLLMVGLAPFAFAQYLTIWMLGTLLGLLLLFALISDLIFLPALLFLFFSPKNR